MRERERESERERERERDSKENNINSGQKHKTFEHQLHAVAAAKEHMS